MPVSQWPNSDIILRSDSVRADVKSESGHQLLMYLMLTINLSCQFCYSFHIRSHSYDTYALVDVQDAIRFSKIKYLLVI